MVRVSRKFKNVRCLPSAVSLRGCPRCWAVEVSGSCMGGAGERPEKVCWRGKGGVEEIAPEGMRSVQVGWKGIAC